MANSSMNALRKFWESSAPGWAKWEDILSQNLVSVTKIMFNMAEILPGMKVLGLASGAGSQTLMVADLVCPASRHLTQRFCCTPREWPLCPLYRGAELQRRRFGRGRS